MGSSKKSSKNKDTHRDDDDVAEPSPPRTADIFRTNDDDLETQEANVQDVQNELPASNNDQAVKKRLMIKRAVVTVLLFFCLAGIATVVILLATSAPFKNKVDENAAVSPGETTQPNTPPITPPTSVGDGGSRPTTPQGGGGAANTPTSPPKMATSAPTAGSLARIVSYLQGETGINFNEDGSEALAYKQAVTWLAQDTDEPVYDAKLIQRFAVLAVDFALKGSSQSDGAIDEIEPTIGVHDIDECTWQGIVCNGTTVVELHLPRLNLSGTIPPSISLLSDITHIDLNTNDIHGTIPESLYDLTGLNSLYLYKNQLQGFVSTSIRKLTNLENLWLNENAMTGPFPVGISSTDSFIHPIRHLNLYKNQFVGTIPNNMRLRRLVYMDLGRNQFSGTLPSDIGEKYVVLRHLYLDHNNFVGSIPTTFPAIGNDRLESLALDDNQLTGVVPGGHEILNHLVQYTLGGNNFSGMDKDVCKLSVMQGGEMVEFNPECDICVCNDEVACGKC